MLLAAPAVLLTAGRARIPVEDITPRLTRSAREMTRLLDAQQSATDAGDMKASKELIDKITDPKRRKLITVEPTASNRRLIQQLVDNDLEPHQLSSVAEFMAMRLGRDGYHKDCKASVVQSSRGRKILAPIFRYKAVVPTDARGHIHPSNLPGKIDKLISELPRPETGRENLHAFTSVSSIMPGFAPKLIREDVPTVTPQGVATVTTSPMHRFTSTFEREAVLKGSDDAVRAQVIDYLSDLKDPVAKLHMYKGQAVLGWVHVNRDAPEGSPNWVSANFIYHRKVSSSVRSNWQRYRALTLSTALHEVLSVSESPKFGKCDRPIVVAQAHPG